MKTPKFKNVDEMLDYIPEHELILALNLREIIYSILPSIREKLSYNVAFYSLSSSICFIWPSSVLWGRRKTYEGVRMGFTKGYLLVDPENLLNKANRKQMFSIDFLTVDDITKNQKQIANLLLNAQEVDLDYSKLKYTGKQQNEQ